MKWIKYLIYPVIILLVAGVLVHFRENGSSVSMYTQELSLHAGDNDKLVIGKAREVKKEQYLVHIPLLLSQDINNEPAINTDISTETNVSTESLPQGNVWGLFKPQYISYYFTNDTEFNYSFYWHASLVLLLISVYLLLLQLTNNNLTISIFGSLIFLQTPLLQWNETIMEPITWMSFALFFFLKIIEEKKRWKSIILGVFLTYFSLAFIFVLRPSLQAPIVYPALALLSGAVIANYRNIRIHIRTIAPVILGSMFCICVLLFIFYNQNKDVITAILNSMTNDSVPGTGKGDIIWLFSGFYNLLLQFDTNTAPFIDQQGTSNFFLLFPPLLVWMFYKNIFFWKNKNKIDIVGTLLGISVVFLFICYLAPLPDFVSNITLLSNTYPQGIIIGIGYASYLLMFYMLGRRKLYRWRKAFGDFLLGIVLMASYAYIIYVIGNNAFNLYPAFFSSPDFLDPNIEIYVITGFVFLVVFFFLCSWRELFLLNMCMFSLFSVLFVNPIYLGLDIMTDTEIGNYITDLSRQDDSTWLVYGYNNMAQYALANGADVLNAINIYPHYDLWNVLDPDGTYYDVYNKSDLSIVVNDKSVDKVLVEPLSNNSIMLNIDPCDFRLNLLNVKYVLSTYDLDNSCLTKLQSFGANRIYSRSTENIEKSTNEVEIEESTVVIE